MKDTINVNCPVAATLQLIGGKYKALLLWHLSGKILRFNELRRLVPEATPKCSPSNYASWKVTA